MSTAGTLSAFPLLIRATSLANAGRLEEAAQQVIAHLRQRPEDPLGLAKLGEIAMLLGALGQAEHFFRRALAAGSRDIAVQRENFNLAREGAKRAERPAARGQIVFAHGKPPGSAIDVFSSSPSTMFMDWTA